MIFINKNINPMVMKIYVNALHINTWLHKSFGNVLTCIAWLNNLGVSNMPFIN